MTEPNTHPMIDASLCGEVAELSPGRAVVRLETSAQMVADPQGLVHGGFVFGAVDYAAMLAVNDPNVVLGGADVRFVAPVALGDVVEATARVIERRGKKRVVEVRAAVASREVLTGVMTAFVLEEHVLTSRT
mgnify:CR=1 FL=1